MKVVVTGASGFLGRSVLGVLDRLPVQVFAVTRSKHNDLPKLTNGIWIEFDLENYDNNLFSLLGSPDVLIHLAWNGLPNYNSLCHFESELPIQYNFISSLVKSGLKTVVVSGTCFEYGMKSNSLSENIDTKPSNPYGFAKDCLRKQLEFLSVQHNFSLVWARLFYLYGGGQSHASIYSQLRRSVNNSEKIFNMSGGEQLRDYLPVGEAANYLVNLALMRKDLGIVNVCSGSPVKVKDLVGKWLEENDWNIELNLGFYPYPDYEPFSFWGDNSYLLSILQDQDANLAV